jgi:hypothetical protein
MQQRNWLDLDRKLVDRFDMDFTVTALQAALGEYALNYFGFGVLPTALYPNPFPITMSGSVLGGTVGNGIAFNENGYITRIDTASSTSKNFLSLAADTVNPRWDLLVIRYKATGDTPVPKPSDPILTVSLNYHDDFVLAVIKGTASATPSYPAAGPLDVILCGLRIPANATLGTQVIVDLAVRNNATNNIVEQSVFMQEVPTGVIDGSNVSFVVSQTPASNQSILVMKDDGVLKSSEWSIVGTTITLAVAPAIGQDIYVYYIVKSVTSVNPLLALQEQPSGTVDGTNDTFYLTGKPAAQAPTLAIVDGRIITADKWILQQNAIQDSIKFLAGNIPQPGQDVYVFYLIDPATVGAAPGGGGGTGALVTVGTMSSPLAVDPTVGVLVTTDQRQMKFISSTGGADPVTASPQIAPGTVVGQELELVGTSDTDYLIISDGNGTSQNGPINLKRHSVILYAWDGSVWFERSRR